MKILLLGPAETPLASVLRAQGESVRVTSDKLVHPPTGYDFLISYNYRFILRKDVLDLFPGRAINLHISLLPWNRGADPNFWSYFDDSPKGVTIHHIDEGVDTGAILVQEESTPTYKDTLEESYQNLHKRITKLFERTWFDIKSDRIAPKPQAKNAGTFHRKIDLKSHQEFLAKEGWKTLTGAVRDYGKSFRISSVTR